VFDKWLTELMPILSRAPTILVVDLTGCTIPSIDDSWDAFKIPHHLLRTLSMQNRHVQSYGILKCLRGRTALESFTVFNARGPLAHVDFQGTFDRIPTIISSSFQAQIAELPNLKHLSIESLYFEGIRDS
jgi:hypothetical protein